ncbi:3-ketoacyl-ACP reductase [Pseudogemmobacter faecipullorum]|uniref:3-ketoacyl-ACP reductase n=1 Tax=Pseudogemmobacter faecipullorum TaxID=2755041 RepID=A0ABS8CPP9_9RHOB|nr:3-ketoacyl-ACP reductase [Pseudogemmobacter faecipullorum]MCB5411363.1 3-ketoacyl-ACP reductase [Pseudogemmobacter faecipullorum]
MKPHALITGGQQGIGFGIAQSLAAAGWQITLAAEQPQDCARVRAALAQLPAGSRYFAHDLRQISAVPALLARIEADLPLTSLIANAGVPALQRGDLLELRPESFDRCHEVNLRGTFFLAQAVARTMLRHPGPGYRSLIFITSVSAEMASPERAEYCISKAGASMMAKNFALRLAAEGIGVFELRPGIIATPMTEGVHQRYEARIREGLVPAGRWGQPADIGKTVLPLVEGRMGFATGSSFAVDGGLSIPRL